MSSFYDDASLVVIPSGYKTSKVYAEKPTDGSGDLAFTRTGDTATRVNSAGLVEKVRTNVVTYSQDFSDASWTKNAITISTSATANPVNGTLTAQDAIPTAVLSSHRVLKLSGVASSLNTWSIYAKAKGYNFITLVENGNTSANVSFNLSTGTIGQQNSATGRIESLGNGWYRCSMIHTTSTTPRFDIYVSPTDSIASYTADGTSGVTLFGAQTEVGDIATDYIPTTTAAVSVGPVSNVPRLDYLGSSCPRLLLEPQRTNLITYSEQFDNAAWVKTNAGTGVAPVVTANNAISPDGTQNADTVVFNSGAGTTSGDQSYLYQTLTTGAGSHTASFYAKTASGTAQLLIRLNSANYQKITITSQWQRFTLTQTLTAGTNYLDFILRRGIDEPLNSSATIQLWGAQLEAGAYATSYIPTLGTSVTRVADDCVKSSATSIIGQTEGVAYVDFEFTGNYSSGGIIPISLDGGSGFEIYFWVQTNGTVLFDVYNGGLQASINGSIGAVGRKKVAIAYKQNDFALYINGVQIGTDTSGTVPATNRLYVGRFYANTSYNMNSGVNQALVFKTRLTNAQLAELTTL